MSIIQKIKKHLYSTFTCLSKTLLAFGILITISFILNISTVNAQGVGADGGSIGGSAGAVNIGGSAGAVNIGGSAGAVNIGGEIGDIGSSGWFPSASEIGNEFFEAIIKGTSSFLVSLGEGSFTLAMSFFNYIIGPTFVNRTLTDDTNVISMWSNVRDLTNMLIVLGFVFIGISTILRLRDYEAKKLLFRLILVAILINFSGLVCESIFNLSNIVQGAFLENGSNNVTAIKKNMDTFVSESLKEAKNSGALDRVKSAFKVLGTSIITFLLLLFGTIVFFMLAVLLAARYAILIVLYIVSPLAFLSWVFPFTKTYFNKWWEYFIRWSFLGVVAGFLIYLGISSLASAGAQISALMVSFVYFFLAYKLSKSGAAIGSGAIMAGAGAAAAYATGGVSAVAGKALSVGKEFAGRTEAGRKTGEFLSGAGARIAESTGFAKQGSAAQQQAGRQKEARSKLEALRTSSNDRDKRSYESYVKSGKGAMGAEAVSLATDKKELGKIMGNDVNAMNQRVSYAESFGNRDIRKDASKINPNLAGTPEGIKKAVEGYDPINFVKNVDSKAYTPEVIQHMSHEQMARLYSHGNIESKEAFKNGSRDYLNNLNTKNPSDMAKAQEFQRKLTLAQASGRTSSRSSRPQPPPAPPPFSPPKPPPTPPPQVNTNSTQWNPVKPPPPNQGTYNVSPPNPPNKPPKSTP